MKKILLFLVITILSASSIVSSTFALPSSILDFFDRNGIYYYNPDGFSDGCYVGLGS